MDEQALRWPAHFIKLTGRSDVTNPLCGSDGASFDFGPQKGARKEMAQMLEDGLRNFSRVINKHLGLDIQKLPGAGAAGASEQA